MSDSTELDLPRIAALEATKLGELVRAIEEELETAHAVATRAEILREALIDAIATGAAKIADTSQRTMAEPVPSSPEEGG